MVGAVLALVVQKQAKEISILMVIACSAVILALAAWFLEPVVDFVTELRLLGQLDGATVTILLKTAGIGLLAELAGAVCEDAGEGTLAKMVRAVRQCSGLVPGSAPIYQCAGYDWGYAEEVKPCGSG